MTRHDDLSTVKQGIWVCKKDLPRIPGPETQKEKK